MSFISNWKDKITEYLDLRLQLIKLAVIERMSQVLGYLVFVIIILSLLLPILIFGGMGLSEVFTSLFDSRIAGYFTTAGVYLIITLILILARKNIANMFANIFVTKLTEIAEEAEEQAEKKQSSQ